MRRTPVPNPRVRFRIDFGNEHAVGLGKIALLEQIGNSGSLSQAARNLDMSYRRAWQLLDSLNCCFTERVAITAKGGRHGGGATLTPFGQQLIRLYRAFDAETQVRASERFRSLKRIVRTKRRAVTGRRGPRSD